MQDYNLALFIHLIGVIALFSATAIRLTALLTAGRVPTVAMVRVLARLALVSDKVMPVAGLATIGSGAYMVHDLWNWDMGWIAVALAVVLPMFVVGPLVNSPRLARLARDADAIDDGPVPSTLSERINDPVLHLAENVMSALMIGVVYLMATKPDLAESIAAVAVAAFAGLLLTVVTQVTAPARQPVALTPAEAPQA